jgi:hypothetical protein
MHYHRRSKKVTNKPLFPAIYCILSLYSCFAPTTTTTTTTTEKASSSGMMEVQSKTFDRISFKWNGKAGAKLMVRFNCLSTDFSRIKGVKGIPLRVHVDTTTADSSSGTGAGEQNMERSFAKIKLFRDKVKYFFYCRMSYYAVHFQRSIRRRLVVLLTTESNSFHVTDIILHL